LKVEKRGNSGFISHNGLTIFFNKHARDYDIRVQKAEQKQDGKREWHLVGQMTVENEAFKQLQQILAGLT